MHARTLWGIFLEYTGCMIDRREIFISFLFSFVSLSQRRPSIDRRASMTLSYAMGPALRLISIINDSIYINIYVLSCLGHFVGRCFDGSDEG